MDQERVVDDVIMLPGFRFHPTDEELVGFYLKRKVEHKPLSIELIKQLDIYKYDPWDLPKFAMTNGEKEWYFYCPRDRKYRNSERPNRVTGGGFWKATGRDRPIYSYLEQGTSKSIGLKKSLVFYRGRAAKGTKTDWMMHEFRLPSLTPDHNKSTIRDANESWAICKIFKKTSSMAAQRAQTHSWLFDHYLTNSTSETTTDIPDQVLFSLSHSPQDNCTTGLFHTPPQNHLSSIVAKAEPAVIQFGHITSYTPIDQLIDCKFPISSMETSCSFPKMLGEMNLEPSPQQYNHAFENTEKEEEMSMMNACYVRDDDDDNDQWRATQTSTSPFNLLTDNSNEEKPNLIWDPLTSCQQSEILRNYSVNDCYT